MIKGFLFDLDGVIVDTAVFHFKAWRKMANKLGFDIDEAFNETLKGISRRDSIDRILAYGGITLSEEEIERLAKEKNEDYLTMVDTMTKENILPGVQELIAQIKEQNYKMALGSASKNAPRILDRIGLIHEFDAIVDGNSVNKSKPDPEVFIKGADALGLKNEECVVVEDAYAGVEAAIAAGMKSIGIGEQENLPNANIVIHSFENKKIEDLLADLQ